MELNDRKKLIGKRIKEMREKAGLNQTQLASELSNGVKTDRGKSTISEYEHGKNLNLDNIHRIAEVLNNHVPCDENYLLGCIDHPDITTSWIAEQIPLSRNAIERLQYLRNPDNYTDNDFMTEPYYEIVRRMINTLIISLVPRQLDRDNPANTFCDSIHSVYDLKRYYSVMNHFDLKKYLLAHNLLADQGIGGFMDEMVDFINAGNLGIEGCKMRLMQSLAEIIDAYIKAEEA